MVDIEQRRAWNRQNKRAHRERMRAHRERMRAAGRCAACGRARVPGKESCAPCLEAKRHRRQKTAAEMGPRIHANKVSHLGPIQQTRLRARDPLGIARSTWLISDVRHK